MVDGLRKLGVVLALFLGGWSYAVSYTVQVIAVSTQAIASKLQEQLRDLGYEAYLVRVPTAEGPVFRIRVGAFANRAAASLFAEAMQGVLDSNPTPALADGIPDGLVPLEADLVGKYSSLSHDLEVLPWQGEVAFRVQDKRAEEQANYRVVDIVEFDAWRAEPRSDGMIIRVYSHYLWPEAWTIRTAAELELERQRQINDIALELELTVEQLESFQFRSSEGVPYLVLVEVFEPRSLEGSFLPALGQPASSLSKFGPDLVWFGQQIDIDIIQPVFTANPFEGGQSVSLESREGWQAREDGKFIEISNETPEKTWRAAVGQPLWVRENWLIAAAGSEMMLYRFQIR